MFIKQEIIYHLFIHNIKFNISLFFTIILRLENNYYYIIKVYYIHLFNTCQLETRRLIMNKNKSSLPRSLKYLLLLSPIIFIGLLFLTGEIRFIPTLQMGYEVQGYFGRPGTVFKSAENLDRIINELTQEKKFKGHSFNILDVFATEDRMVVTLQDPITPTHFDQYVYNTTNLLFSEWEYDRPYKIPLKEDIADVFPYEKINGVKFYQFYKLVQNHIEKENIELDLDLSTTYHIRIDYTNRDSTKKINYIAYVHGIREDVSFEADEELTNVIINTN